jgi:hypothetical protein
VRRRWRRRTRTAPQSEARCGLAQCLMHPAPPCGSQTGAGTPTKAKGAVGPVPGDRRVAAGPQGGRRPPAGPALKVRRESCNESERSRIDRPLLPERLPSGRPVSGTCGQAGVCGDLWPGRVSGRLPHAGHQRGHGWSLRQPPRTWQLVWRPAGHESATAATAGHSRVQTRWAWSVSCQHGDPDRPCGK